MNRTAVVFCHRAAKLLALLASVSAFAGATATGPVLTVELTGGDGPTWVARYWSNQVRRATGRLRQQEWEAAADRQRFEVWQRSVRSNLWETLGPWPERTPLNAKVVRTIVRDGYRLEHVLFESRPNHHVTASLFLPDSGKFPPPWPVMLVPCGHSRYPRTGPATGQGLRAYLRACVVAAWNGIAAFIYDPIDQGERLQVLPAPGGRELWGTQAHNQLGALAILVGWNTASFRAWDGIRALDYICSRPDLDTNRIACAGNSGGGTMTAWLTALDDRIRVAAPSCFISTLFHVITSIGPQDAEQNLWAQLTWGLDHSECLTVPAPVPVLVCAKEEDFFPIDGTRESVDWARKVLSRLGWEHRVDLLVDEGKHGWSEAHFVGTVQWFRRWWGCTEPLRIPPAAEDGPPAREMQILPDGQVMNLPGEKSAYDFVREAAEQWAARRGHPRGRNLVERVRRRTGIRTIEELGGLRWRPVGQFEHQGVSIVTGVFERDGEMPLPAFRAGPERATRRCPIVLVDSRGKSALLDVLAREAAAGRMGLALDLRGFGELSDRQRFYGSEWADEGQALTAYVLGRCFMGERAEELILVADWFKNAVGAAGVEVWAANWAVTPALHAALVEPDRIHTVRVRDAPLAWEEAVQKSVRHSFADVVHGVLRDYCIGDLRDELGARVQPWIATRE